MFSGTKPNSYRYLRGQATALWLPFSERRPKTLRAENSSSSSQCTSRLPIFYCRSPRISGAIASVTVINGGLAHTLWGGDLGSYPTRASLHHETLGESTFPACIFSYCFFALLR